VTGSGSTINEKEFFTTTVTKGITKTTRNDISTMKANQVIVRLVSEVMNVNITRMATMPAKRMPR